MEPRRLNASNLPLLLAGLALAAVAGLGVATTDVGLHWDEINITKSVKESYATGLLLPRWYNYPSLSYDVGMLAALPSLVVETARAGRIDSARAGVAREAAGPRFNLRLRAVFFVLCTLAGLPVFLLARRLTGSGWPALFGALSLVLAWEFLYQARWIAPDGLLMVAAAFAIWSQHHLVSPDDPPRRAFWRNLSAVLAGFCAGAKYPGALMLVPLMLALATGPGAPKRFSALVREVMLVMLVFAITFVLITPGIVFEPGPFASDVQHEVRHYREGHGGHTVGPGWHHFSTLAAYLGLVFLSRNAVLAGLGAALAIFGAVSIVRGRRGLGVWLLAFPLILILYMSSQRVMIVRNELVLLPFFAVSAAAGAYALARRGAGRWAAIGLAVLLVGFNAWVAVRSAQSILRPSQVPAARAIERRVSGAPKTRFFLSPVARRMLDSLSAAPRANVVDSMPAADRFIFATYEVADWQQMAANRRGRYQTVWSAMDEVNWDYYPTWPGHPRMLEVSARALTAR